MAHFSSRAAAAAATIPSMVLWMRSRCCAVPRLERQGSGESSRASVVLKSHQPANLTRDIRVHEAHEFGELLGIGRCDQQVVVIREDDLLRFGASLSSDGLVSRVRKGGSRSNALLPRSGRVCTRNISFPRRQGVAFRGKSRSPAGSSPFSARKAKPPRGIARLHGKMSIPRRPMSDISLEMSIPRGGRAFSGSARRSPAGERDFPLQMRPGRRGISILTAKAPSPRGGTRFSAANEARTAGDRHFNCRAAVPPRGIAVFRCLCGSASGRSAP
jgi:hypothetical protein